jgi:hypothetical protein
MTQKYDPTKLLDEIWKSVPEFKDYIVSNLEKVKSLKFNREKILNSKKDKYEYVTLYNGNNKRCISIHRLIAELFKGFVPTNDRSIIVDHLYNNTHDNSENMLQVISQRVNTVKGNMNSRSNHVGVSWRENRKIWRVRILYNNKRISLGSFKDKEEAIELHKQFIKDIEQKTFSLNDYIGKRNKRNLVEKQNHFKNIKHE